jgi:Mce-associated membrane protein
MTKKDPDIKKLDATSEVAQALDDGEVEEADLEEPESTADGQDTEDTATTASDEDVAEDSEADEADDSESDDSESDEDDGPLLGKRAKKQDKSKRRFRRNQPWGHYLRRGALPLLLAASLAVSGFLGWKQWQYHQVKVAGQEAQQAAIKYAQVLTSIDSNNVDDNFRQVLDGATGEFKDMYTQSSVQLRQLLIDNKASAHGVVVDSAIASESADRVVVLVFIDQTVANMAVPDPRIDRSRIKMTMEKVDGRWRASKVQLL